VTAERLLGLRFPITGHALCSAAQAGSVTFLWARSNGRMREDRAVRCCVEGVPQESAVDARCRRQQHAQGWRGELLVPKLQSNSD
jgi:hypothetical protein